MTGKRPLRIGLLGQFGIGNLGNEGSLESMLRLLKRRAPTALITVICSDPDWVNATYSVNTTSLRVPGSSSKPGRVWGRIRNIGYAMTEAAKLDVLLVPGTGILDDFNESPFGLPYEIWRWCHAAKLGGARIGFVSVGAGPITRRLSRIFMRGAARSADYRSYRDGLSKAFMDSIGTNRPQDRVFPDLAFGLPTPTPTPSSREGGPLVVAVGVMAYYGWAGGAQGQGVYETYLAKLAAYVGWLIGSGRRVKFVIGARRDAAAVDGLRARVLALDPRHVDGLEPFAPAQNLHDVMQQMAEADIAVVTRFHNLVCALHVGRPTLSLGYGDKNHALMADTGLADFSQPVEEFDLDRLIARTEQMIAERAAREAMIRRQVTHYEAQLAMQEDLLVERFGLA